MDGIKTGNKKYYQRKISKLSEIEQDLLEETEETKYSDRVSPKIIVKLFNKEYHALIDTGADVSAIPSELWNKIKFEYEHKKLPKLPVTNIKIVTACSTSTISAKQQISLPIQINNYVFFQTILILNKLNIPMILGNDFLYEQKVKIDYIEQNIEICTNNQHLITPFVSIINQTRILQLKIIDKQQNSVIHPIDKEIVNINLINEKELSIKNKVDESILSEMGKNQLLKVFASHNDVFSDRPGLCNKYKYELKVIEHCTMDVKKMYPIPESKRIAVREEINKLLNEGIISPSQSQYCSPLVVVNKKSGGIRVCIDSRKINQILIKEYTQTESIDTILSRFTGLKYISAIDLVQSFLQIPLHENSRKYTAFIHEGKCYEYNVVPFGLINSSASFIHAMNIVLGKECEKFVLSYVDDLLILSENEEEHIEHVNLVLKRIKDAGMTVNFRKSEFAKEEVEFLGYNLTKEGLSMSKEKKEKVLNFPAPRNKKQVQSFLGLCNFYRKFIQNFSKLLLPLNRLLQKESIFIWTSEHEEAFTKFKEAFGKAIILHYPNYSEPFYISTDASKFTIASHLYQYENGEPKPIMFISRTLNKHEIKYGITEKELLSVVFSCMKYRIIILGYPTKVLTDHQCLKFLFQTKWKNERLTRWSMYLQQFDLNIGYVKGKDNIIADALTRDLFDESYDSQPNVVRINFLSKNTELYSILSNITKEQKDDKIWGSVLNKVNKNELGAFYKIHNNILFMKIKKYEWWRVCIPERIVERLIWNVHENNGHPGISRTIMLIVEKCVINNLRKKATKILRRCQICAKIKPNNQVIESELMSLTPTRPLEIIAIDVKGPLVAVGKIDKIVIITCTFSKYVRLYPIQKANTYTIIKKLENFINTIGKPDRIISDNGTPFVSSAWNNFLRVQQIKNTHISSYNPRANPAERVLKEVGILLRLFAHKKHTTWLKHLPKVEKILNNMPSSVTGFRPIYLMCKGEGEDILENVIKFPDKKVYDYKEDLETAKQNILKSIKIRRIRHNRKVTVKFNEGDLVLIKNNTLSNKNKKRCRKLDPLYIGPYMIKKTGNNGAYVLENVEKGHEIGWVNQRNLKLYRT